MPEKMLFGQDLGPEPPLHTKLVPELDLSPVASTWAEFGADANGRPLIAEMYTVLDRDHVTDESEQEMWLGFWSAMTGERMKVAAEKQDRVRKEMESKR